MRRFAIVVFAGIALAAAAQDGGPSSSYPAPYPRPTAKSVLQNDRINIWDVTWPKGYATPMHEHRLDQLSITLHEGRIRLTTPNRPPTESSSKYASVTFVKHGTVHQEEGVSDEPQHKIMLEVKPSPENDVHGTAPGEGATKLLDNARLVAWDMTWEPGQTIHRPTEDLDSVIVFLEPGTIHTSAGDKAVAQGDVIYKPKGGGDSVETVTNGKPRAIIVELK